MNKNKKEKTLDFWVLVVWSIFLLILGFMLGYLAWMWTWIVPGT